MIRQAENSYFTGLQQKKKKKEKKEKQKNVEKKEKKTPTIQCKNH